MSELTGAFHDIAAAMAAMAAPSQPATSRAALTHVAIVEAAGAGDAEAPARRRRRPLRPAAGARRPVERRLSAQSRPRAGGHDEVAEAGRGR